MGGAGASWLEHSTPDRVVRVRILDGDIVLCSWARHFTLTVPLSTQVYKWVPANSRLGLTLRWTSTPSRGETKFSLSLHAKETGDKLRRVGPLGLKALTLLNHKLYEAVLHKILKNILKLLTFSCRQNFIKLQQLTVPSRCIRNWKTCFLFLLWRTDLNS